jgi:hypothetical protein
MLALPTLGAVAADPTLPARLGVHPGLPGPLTERNVSSEKQHAYGTAHFAFLWDGPPVLQTQMSALGRTSLQAVTHVKKEVDMIRGTFVC